jgi:tetratricopeptide (TPR) repeat protein
MKAAKCVNLIFSIFSVFLISVPARAGTPAGYAEANRLYEDGEFEAAKELYEQIVRSGNYSADLFYNLGNTSFRLGDVGKAALNFRRAVELEPDHAEAKANLKFVRDTAHAKVPDPPAFTRFFPDVSASGWTIGLAIFGWAGLYFLVSLIFARRRNSLWFGAICSLLLCAYAGVGLWMQRNTKDLGVVIATETEARFAPARTARLAERLPAASEIQMLATRGRWTYCELPNGTRAWVPTDGIAAVRPSRS